MAQINTLVGIRDQVLAFLRAQAGLAGVSTWTTSLRTAIPDEGQAAGVSVPVGAVLWALQSQFLEVDQQACGLIDAEWLTLWATFTTVSAVSDVAAQDAAMALAQSAIRSLRTQNGRMLSQGGSTAAENVSIPRVVLSRARVFLDTEQWYATVALQLVVRNTLVR